MQNWRLNLGAVNWLPDGIFMMWSIKHTLQSRGYNLFVDRLSGSLHGMQMLWYMDIISFHLLVQAVAWVLLLKCIFTPRYLAPAEQALCSAFWSSCTEVTWKNTCSGAFCVLWLFQNTFLVLNCLPGPKASLCTQSAWRGRTRRVGRTRRTGR